MKIREASPIDGAIITEFNLRMAWETEQRRLDPQRVGQGVTALLNDPAKGSYYVVEVQTGERWIIAGQLLITYEWSDWRNGNFWWIQSVYVDKSARGQGVFKSLYAHVVTEAKKVENVLGIKLYVDRHNGTAIKSYPNLGLHRSNYEIYYRMF